MRIAGLLAWSFVRQNRWPTLALLAWVLVSAGLARQEVSQSAEEALYLYKLALVYVIGFTAFLAASVIASERNSRRILGVLSKGITRKQYLMGIVLACGGIPVICCLAMVVTGAWLFGGAAVGPLLALMAAVLAASLMTGTASLLFSTFLNPILAVAAASGLLAAAGMARVRFPLQELLLPVSPLASSILEFSLSGGWNASWMAVLGAIAEAALLWLAACWIFQRRDIALAVD
ncbi:MAG TPA: hypothetical protein VK473_18845 [Terriglobales bacterium]|nr:hypothetical protein [Terriglobales bacterium]